MHRPVIVALLATVTVITGCSSSDEPYSRPSPTRATPSTKATFVSGGQGHRINPKYNWSDPEEPDFSANLSPFELAVRGMLPAETMLRFADGELLALGTSACETFDEGATVESFTTTTAFDAGVTDSTVAEAIAYAATHTLCPEHASRLGMK